jgi:hypothetical protein
MKNWQTEPGTCRTLVWAQGAQIAVCHPCRRFTDVPVLEVPIDPCPFVRALQEARRHFRPHVAHRIFSLSEADLHPARVTLCGRTAARRSALVCYD